MLVNVKVTGGLKVQYRINVKTISQQAPTGSLCV